MITSATLLAPVSPPPLAPLAQTAQRVFQHLIQGFQTADLPTVLACFTEEAIIEYPYAPQMGTAARLDGKPAIRQYLQHALQGMPPLVFSQLYLAHDVAQGIHWAEVHCEAPVPGTDRTYRQDYVMRFELRGEQIQHYREYWNQLAGREAFGGPEEARQVFTPTAPTV
ncbi:nuclear transport factor 2 family protein [Hymenobacter volaticus]|uniref:Nuclear transport factor 2 family protein n=1 Tax=Hymenobacter volaticus TaxID=2932254 RepID=A0ABY4GFC5_9BACT|nr:nuclear transport factor 2 family protein [Hymenobacter volaticus]UOQ69500.1 nuclear transport factor 2 family protein [Hymenobacter volaticus]